MSSPHRSNKRGTTSTTSSTSKTAGTQPFHTFDGRPKGQAQRKVSFSQASLRRTVTLWDQHGRQWWASVEQRSGMPVGMIEPKDFTAPWLPDQKYLVVNPDNASELFIDYRTAAVDRKTAENEYHVRASQLAAEKKWAQPERGQYPTEIVNALGRPPRSVKLVLAAWQGNPWMLGETDTPDPRLELLVEAERPQLAVTPEDIGDEDFGPESFAEQFGEEFAELKTGSAELPLADPRAGRRVVDTSPATPEELEAFESDDTTAEEAGLEALLNGVDEEHDAQALGGKTVAPKNIDRARRQAPRPATQKATRKKQGTHRSQKERRRRPSLADGATPVIAGE